MCVPNVQTGVMYCKMGQIEVKITQIARSTYYWDIYTVQCTVYSTCSNNNKEKVLKKVRGGK